MRGVINTLVFSVALRTGGPLGNQAECRSAFYPGQQWQREDGTACTKRHMRWLWAGCDVPEVVWPSCALKQNHCKKIQNDGPIPCKPHVSHPPWCDPPVVWVSSAETSIKNMTIITDFVMGLEESDACGTAGSTAGSELVLHLGRKSNPAAFSSAVSVGEIFLPDRAGNDAIRLRRLTRPPSLCPGRLQMFHRCKSS